MGLSLTPDIEQTINAAARRYGIDPAAMRAIAHIESRGNPNARNPNSSAGGLYQFIDSTARQYGLEDRFDAGQAADAGARLARDNSAHLRRALGRDPTSGEIYLAHQQGAGGATRLLRDPDERAVDIVGADAVRLNGGHAGMSAGDFANIWTSKADNLVGGGVPAIGGATGPGAASGTMSNDAFQAAIARHGSQPPTAQTARQNKSLTMSQKLGGVGASLIALDQGQASAMPYIPPDQKIDLSKLFDRVKQTSGFARNRGLSL